MKIYQIQIATALWRIKFKLKRVTIIWSEAFK
jgi:hypothetical protein